MNYDSFSVESVILDVSCTITDARMIFVKKLEICARHAELFRHDIAFPDLIDKFRGEKREMNKLFRGKRVPDKNIDVFWDTWKKIPEYTVGDVPIFHGSIPTLKELVSDGLNVYLACRLEKPILDAVYKELRLSGLRENIRREFPSTEERMKKGCMKDVLERVISKTSKPRLFVDDSPGRIRLFKNLDTDSICVGITQGFYSKQDFKDADADEAINSISNIRNLIA